MAEITAALVKELRDATKAGMMDCKKALKENGGDIEKAKDWLRKKNLAKATDMAGRSTAEGRVFSYIHHNQRVGVLLEAGCETDFVADNQEFAQMFQDICIHVAAMRPKWLKREDVPAAEVEREMEIIREQSKDKIEGKPEDIAAKILDGKMGAYFKQYCLLEQPFVKDDKQSVGEIIKSFAGTVGENIQIQKYARYEIGV